MPKNREIVLRATAVSGVMTNFLNTLADDALVCPDVAGTPLTTLTLRIRAGSREEEKKILASWGEFILGYRHSQINFLEPEIQSICDPLAPLGPDD